MQTSYIYVIGTEQPPYKIGISKNPQRRLKNLQTGHPELLRIHSIKPTNCQETKLLETVIHRNLKHYKLKGEWFNINLKDALLEIDYALMKFQDDPLLKTFVKLKMTY
jgi:Meiotically up-regulated gene 113